MGLLDAVKQTRRPIGVLLLDMEVPDLTGLETVYELHVKRRVFLVFFFNAFVFVFDMTSILIISVIIDISSLSFILSAMILSKALLLLMVLLVGDFMREGHSLSEWIKLLPVPIVTVVAIVAVHPMTSETNNPGVAGLLLRYGFSVLQQVSSCLLSSSVAKKKPISIIG